MSIKDFGRHKYQITMGDGFIQDCFAVQNDSESRTYEFQIFDIDNKVKNASNISIKLAVDTGKGKVVLADGELITPEKGIFAVTLNASQLQEYGDLDAQIMLTEGTRTLRSKIFKINVCASIFEGGTYGKNLILDFNEFAKMVKKVDEWVTNPETLKGPKGDKGDPGQNATVVNNLTSGGADKALSAEMGKNLNELIISGLDNLASKLR